MSSLQSVLILATVCLLAAQGARYEFLLDNDAIFDNCPGEPDNNGIHDGFDISQANIHFADGSLHCGGNVTCIWKGVQPTDRIAARVDLFKSQRGTWQPTPFTIVIQDYCPIQFDKATIAYQVWSSHIPENERICLNNIGHVYHHQDFAVDSVYEFAANMEGRHKVVVQLAAFDEQNFKRPNTICFQIFGEFFKVK